MSELITSVESQSSHPSSIVLEQNYPNPFNPSTIIRFTLPHSGPVSLEVFSAFGEHVATLISENLSAGTHQTEWDAHGLPGGVYFYRLQSGASVETRSSILIK
ncbi:MAG: T9SS type A sorting domain-containing protein [Ignavibacteria bacterium]|nr:T9SS type A sorting domain-containing protein [Ignavibacteria bacterium]